MNIKDYTYLLNRPYSVNERQTMELEAVLSEFPYLQSARAIHLKGLYNQDSFRYNLELKKTAAYTTDRSVLFDFITSEQFQSIQKKFFEDNEKAVTLINVKDSEVIHPAPNRLEESIKLTIEEAGAAEAREEKKETGEPPEDKLEIGRPLGFGKEEKHSFAEWLQISRLSPIQRDEKPEVTEQQDSLAKKLELIDRFIEANPKIVAAKNTTATPVNIEKTSNENPGLMTETLARVYLEQKKYQKAIQAYEILILKYPEKSAFFADRISDIKILQQNNN